MSLMSALEEEWDMKYSWSSFEITAHRKVGPFLGREDMALADSIVLSDASVKAGFFGNLGKYVVFPWCLEKGTEERTGHVVVFGRFLL
jgi:hypothetical protein